MRGDGQCQPAERGADEAPLWYLLCDLLSFDNQNLTVKMSLDNGVTIESLRLRLNDLIIEHDLSIRKLVDHLRLAVGDQHGKVRLISRDGMTERPIHHLAKQQGCCVLRYSQP